MGRNGSSAVAHENCFAAKAIIAESADTNIAYRSAELDQWVRAVVSGIWQGFTSSTEVGIMADSALVSHTADVVRSWLASAQGSIAINTIMNLLVISRFGDGTIDWSETMVGVGLIRSLYA